MKRLFVAEPSRSALLALAVGEEGVVRVPMVDPGEGFVFRNMSSDGQAVFHRPGHEGPFLWFPNPLQPGRVWVPEPWGVGSRPCPRYGWREGIEYRADEALLESKHDLLPLHEVSLPSCIDLLEDYAEGWRSPATMPAWAARLRLELLEEGRPERWCPEGCYDGLVPEHHHACDPNRGCVGECPVPAPCPACDGSPPWWWTAKARRLEL